MNSGKPLNRLADMGNEFIEPGIRYCFGRDFRIENLDFLMDSLNVLKSLVACDAIKPGAKDLHIIQFSQRGPCGKPYLLDDVVGEGGSPHEFLNEPSQTWG